MNSKSIQSIMTFWDGKEAISASILILLYDVYMCCIQIQSLFNKKDLK